MSIKNNHTTLNLTEILDKGSALIKEAGARTIPYFEQYTQRTSKMKIYQKEDNSPVTEADRTTEQWLRMKLKDAFPHFGIIGEEYGEDTAGTPYTWVIDPIDGTKSFITGVPLYTTLLGLIDTESRTPLAGFIYAPITQECVHAAVDMGAWYNDTITKISPCTDLSEATILMYDWHTVYKKSRTLFKLTEKSKMARTWSDGFAYILLASGKAHAIIEPAMNLWDLAPVYTPVLEAGGQIINWNGNTIDWRKNRHDTIACTSKTLLDEIQKYI